MIKTTDDLRAATDTEIDELIEKFGDSKTEDFQKVTGCEFSYSAFSTIISQRGYRNGWHKPRQRKRNFTVKMLEKPDRLNLAMTPECKEQYSKFIKENGWGYVHTTAALTSYMESYKKRHIKVSVDV